MDLEVDGPYITVTLSRRNLLALLHKLDQRDSARTLTKHCDNNRILRVRAQHDGPHYENKLGYGLMSEDTEDYIAQRQQVAA